MQNKTHLVGLMLMAGIVCFALGPANPRTTVSITSPSWEKAATVVVPEVSKKSEESAEIVEILFDKFLTYKTYKVQAVMFGRPTTLKGGFVHGPGHHSAALAALMFDKNDMPFAVIKTGDTRFARVGRGESYVLDGFVAGRMDKEGASSAKIALAELAEEVGGEVLGETFRPLSEELSPTMPQDSTECDAYFMACVKILGKPTGDGGKMEVPELIGAKVLPVSESLKAFDSGSVSDGSRARTMYGRAVDAIGYIPQLEIFVHDHPKLLEKFQTLGLGDVQDLRSAELRSEIPAIGVSESEINHVITVERAEVDLPGESLMIDAQTKHAIKKGSLTKHASEEFPNQYLSRPYDRAKVAPYFVHPKLGPMVLMTKKARPVLKFAPGKPRAFRFDVADAQVPRDDKNFVPLEGARELGEASGASIGQSDVYYQFWAKEMPEPEKPVGEGYVTLGEAIKRCRSGHGDSQTEALLQRLADDLGWLPTLEMSTEEARTLLRN